MEKNDIIESGMDWNELKWKNSQLNEIIDNVYSRSNIIMESVSKGIEYQEGNGMRL